ncbi:MAG: ribonuclease J [Eubacteriales bacterium]|nr:ribonuclease J [Eubacteriales bacterium]
MASKLKIIPLGGVSEIGKNMTVIEYGKDIVVVDCGLAFPDEEMLGIDLVIPDMEYLEKNADKLRGFLITHGHEDHIGALPYALKKFKAPVYGTRLTNALIQHKLDEAGINKADLRCVNPGDTVRLGCFSVEFIKTSHSIAGAVALAITTPIGTLIHTGDFKVDYTPIDGDPIDVARFAYYGTRGVLALLSDSTNVERPGYTQSEREIGKTFESCFDNATGRVIVASFASNIYRIQQIADIAIEHGRVVCFQGRSMVNTAETARELGYLSFPADRVVDMDQLRKYPDDQICVITTGSQGEPMSGLFRMANASHKLNVGKGDTVIISASAIPGNEKGVARVINQLFHNGANVVYEQMADVHVSGHARREELRLMFTLTKPKYFIPVHGEYRHLYMHAGLAKEMGVSPENIFVADIGDIVELTVNSGKINGSVPSGSVMVDGLGIGDIGNVVLRDRKLLSEDGLMAVIIGLQKNTGRLLAGPELISRGFVYMKESEDLINEAVSVLHDTILKFEAQPQSNWSNIKMEVRNTLKQYLYNKTKRTPMILPIIVEIDPQKLS